MQKSEILKNSQITKAEWIIALFSCLVSKWMIVVADNALAKTIERNFQYSFFAMWKPILLPSKPVHRTLGNKLYCHWAVILLHLRCGFGKLHQSKFSCRRPKKSLLKGSPQRGNREDFSVLDVQGWAVCTFYSSWIFGDAFDSLKRLEALCPKCLVCAC